MSTEYGVPQQPGMSTRNKWLIGCGGCLVAVILLVIVLTILGGMGLNALKETSNQSVNQIFGKNYRHEDYTVVGLPAGFSTGQKQSKNMVVLINNSNKMIIFAIDKEITPAETKILKSSDLKAMQMYLQGMSEAFISQQGGDSKIEEISFSSIELAQLKNHKSFPVGFAVIKGSNRGTSVTYTPAVTALIPEAQNNLVTLIALNFNNSSSNPKADFSAARQALEAALMRVVDESDLQQRLQSSPKK